MSSMVVEKCGDRTLDRKHGVCARMHHAVSTGELLADTRRGGWVLTTMPLRHMSPRTRYYITGDKRPNEDHEGEPYLLTEICPFGCGGELPPVAQSLWVPSYDEGDEC